jgi:hypothetical protein
MEELRRKVLPEIFFMCHTVLYENKQYQDRYLLPSSPASMSL